VELLSEDSVQKLAVSLWYCTGEVLVLQTEEHWATTQWSFKFSKSLLV